MAVSAIVINLCLRMVHAARMASGSSQSPFLDSDANTILILALVKNNNLRTYRNTKPANLDLFLQLDAALTAEETKQDVEIGFWCVPRAYNMIADKLAKEAALLGDPE
ncbi:MAG: hypothetical protein Q9166_000655 [cf. Caloplaca sp. 2 TL-2023]